MTGLLESIIRGLGQGAVYAILALGFVIIYKSTRVISFAQPAFMMSGAIACSYLSPVLGFAPALVLSGLAMGMLALGAERLVIRPMVGKPVFIVAIITLGLDVVIRVFANAFLGLDVRQMGDPWGYATLRIGPLEVQQRDLVLLAVGIVVFVALFAFFRYTPVGLAMRATAFDQETALAQGVNVGTVFALSWALAGGLAAIAGVFAAIPGGVNEQFWVVALVALPVIILGGLESLGGAVIGGLAIGVLESVVSRYQGEYAPWLGDNFSVVSPYILMMIVLLVRPYGLFGTPEVVRV